MFDRISATRICAGVASALLVAATVACAADVRGQDDSTPRVVELAQVQQPPQEIGEPSTGEHGSTPGSYAFYKLPGDQPLTEVTFGVTVTTDPGLGNVFWSNQFDFVADPHIGGYTGMQANINGGGMFLFSLWGAIDARPGDHAAYCLDNTDGAAGHSCRIEQRFTPGHTYLFHVRSDGDGWYKAQVEDSTAQTTLTIGSLKVGAGATLNRDTMMSWVEYWDWNNPAATCLDEPYSAARFEVPRADPGSVTGYIASTKISGSCPKLVEVTVGGDERGHHSVQRLAIGNSIGGHLRTPTGDCLTASQVAGIRGCDNKREQVWVAASDKSLRANFACATVGEAGAVIQAKCDGSPAQEWEVLAVPGQAFEGVITNKATARCLTAAGENAILRPCDGSAEQRWSAP